MLTQKGMLRIAEIKGWEIIRDNRGALDLNTGTYYAYFTFKKYPAFQCRVAQSRIEKFKRQIASVGRASALVASA